MGAIISFFLWSATPVWEGGIAPSLTCDYRPEVDNVSVVYVLVMSSFVKKETQKKWAPY